MWSQKLWAMALAIAAVVNLLPLAGMTGAVMLERLYGQAITDPDLLLLLRHRALLFGLVGTACLLAVFRPDWRSAASAAALASMLGFVLLALGQEHAAPIQRVWWVDVVASAVLATAWVIAAATARAR